RPERGVLPSRRGPGRGPDPRAAAVALLSVAACSLWPDMPLLRRRSVHFDVPIQDMTLRITGPEELYEEARAAGMQFWEQVQSYAIRHPGFQSGKRPLPVPEDGPMVIREMVGTAARAGVGPMFTFRGAL